VAGKMAYPLPGALLPIIESSPFTDLYSTRMGILGEIQRAEMIKNYRVKWLNGRPDSTTTAIPALHYIAVTAQGTWKRQHVPHAHAVQTNRYST
jgi:hypothetical protein